MQHLPVRTTVFEVWQWLRISHWVTACSCVVLSSGHQFHMRCTVDEVHTIWAPMSLKDTCTHDMLHFSAIKDRNLRAGMLHSTTMNILATYTHSHHTNSHLQLCCGSLVCLRLSFQECHSQFL